MEIKKYLPIRIHSIDYGIGYWWGKRMFFSELVIVPVCKHYHRTQTLEGKAIEPRYVRSWDDNNYITYGKE